MELTHKNLPFEPDLELDLSTRSYPLAVELFCKVLFTGEIF